jgi:hypothetical protein
MMASKFRAKACGLYKFIVLINVASTEIFFY